MTPSPTYTSPIRGQLASEWQRHKTALIHPLLALVLLTFVLPLFSHTTLLTSVYCLFALLIGTRLAANDVLQGTEEFALSLPATRPQRYAIRAGLLMIVPLCAWIGMQLMVHSVAPRLWGLVVESGFSEPYTLYGLHSTRYIAVTLPLFMGSLAFALSAQSRTPLQVFGAALGAVALFAVVSALCAHLDYRITDRPSVRLLMIVSAIPAPLTLAAGLPLYLRKETTGSPAPGTAALVAAIAAVVALLFIGLLFAKVA